MQLESHKSQQLTQECHSQSPSIFALKCVAYVTMHVM